MRTRISSNGKRRSSASGVWARPSARVRLGLVIMLGLVCSGVGAAKWGEEVFADSPSLTLTVENAVGDKTIKKVNNSDYNDSSYYIPVKINYQDIYNYSVSIKTDSSEMLGQGSSAGRKNSIPSIKAGEAKAIYQMENEWGYRWNIDKTANDANKNYTAIPLSNTTIYTSPSSLASKGTLLTDYLTLGFAASVGGSVPADTYSNKVTVSVLASSFPTTFFDIKYMQDMKPDICADTTTPLASTTTIDTTGEHLGDTNYIPQTSLMDRRDGKSYLVRKLADGNCWMVQNLALEGGTTGLDPSNTDGIPGILGGTLPASSTNRFIESGKTEDDTVAVYNGTHIDSQYDNTTTNTGAYYTFNAATFGMGEYAITDYDEADASICSSNWTLPKKSDLQGIYTAYGSSTTKFKDVFKIPNTGYFSSPSLTANAAAYWSQSSYNGQEAFSLYVASTSLFPQDTSNKWYGLSMRCMARYE